MPQATNRRAVLGAVLAAGAVGATSAIPVSAAEPPSLSTIDQRVLDLWLRRAKLHAISRKLNADYRKASGAEREKLFERCDDAVDATLRVVEEIEDHIEASTHALAAVILMEARDLHEPGHERIFLASLAAIRPQLAGTIADDADRMLAENEEART